MQYIYKNVTNEHRASTKALFVKLINKQSA